MTGLLNNTAARIRRLEPEAGRRIIVISDIHANLPYFKALLKKISFSPEDILILDGDFLEKGPCSLETLHFVMELCAKGNTYAVCGNCDSWDTVLSYDSEGDAHVLRYILYKKRGLMWDMLNEAGINVFELEDFSSCKALLYEKFRAEFDFLASLPHAIETEHFIFVHAGLHSDKPLSAHSADELQRCDAFMKQGEHFSKWVVVGHYPVVLYGKDKVCANPVIDRDSRIISIDGGCVLKDDGQLNALIIPDRASEDFSFAYYDPFPVRTVLQHQPEGSSSYYIRWGDSRVQVLERGEEFSRCRHVRTGYEMDILTKYLFTDNEFTDCNDCTDYVPELFPGDRVSVVENTSRGCFIKHNGCSGWYFGELE